jgi:hypothetical protein
VQLKTPMNGINATTFVSCFMLAALL